MSFFRKLWNALTGNKVKMEVTIDEPVLRSAGRLSGALVLSSKKDQELKVRMQLLEEFRTGRGKSKNFQEMEVGGMELSVNLTGKQGKTIPFSLDFNLQDSKYDKMKEKGGLAAMRGSIGKFMAGEKATYTLLIKASPSGKATPAEEALELKMVHRDKSSEEESE